ncbi:MAG TPA: cadmium resistance transporter [Acidimicrobiales bacterium]|nr:cadmium resistance transporter [Acidimicrobiales bacterium]
MQSALGVIVLASLAFLGTMFDNFFAFAAQLVVTPPERFRRVSWAQAFGVMTLILLAGAVSGVLAPVPLRVIGLVCVAPWALALYAWRHRHEPAREQYRRGAVTTFLITLALGGDNLAVWIPLLRAHGAAGAAGSVAVLLIWESLFVFAAQGIAGHPRVVGWGHRRGPFLVPIVYVLLGVLILVECHTL